MRKRGPWPVIAKKRATGTIAAAQTHSNAPKGCATNAFPIRSRVAHAKLVVIPQVAQGMPVTNLNRHGPRVRATCVPKP